MFSLAVFFFCQSLIQFLKDAVPLSTGNMHHIVGINQPPVQWLLQCLHKEAIHLLPGMLWVCVCAAGTGVEGTDWLFDCSMNCRDLHFRQMGYELLRIAGNASKHQIWRKPGLVHQQTISARKLLVFQQHLVLCVVKWYLRDPVEIQVPPIQSDYCTL